MSTFRLAIGLGNEAMQEGRDIALALRSLAEHLEAYGDLAEGDDGRVRDLNGNTVGDWLVS